MNCLKMRVHDVQLDSTVIGVTDSIKSTRIKVT